MEKSKMDLEFKIGDVGIVTNKGEVANNFIMDTVLEFLIYDSKCDIFVLEGYHLLYGIENETIEPYLIVNKRAISCDMVKRKEGSFVHFRDEIASIIGFRIVFKAVDSMNILCPAVKYNNKIIEMTNCHFGFYFPISDTYQYSYVNLGKYVAYYKGRAIMLTKKGGWINVIKKEILFLCEIWKKKLGNGSGRIGLIYRLLYQIVKLFKHRSLWLISDRIERADDNGEAFYHFLQTHKPRKTKVVFVISKNSDDFQRLSKIGQCVDVGSIRHKILLLLSDIIISSQANMKCGYKWYYEELRDIYAHTKFVFLQHGVTFNDISSYLCYYKNNISGFVTSSVQEYNSINGCAYGYTPEKVWLTGMPRFDCLYHVENKIITIMPTWRKYLMKSFNNKTGLWELKSDFEEQEYFQFYDALINSDRLISFLKEMGYVLYFFPHPNINPHIERFHRNSHVEFLPYSKVNYRNVFAKSKLVVTDYSSSVFDFAYLRKPLLYVQFDKERVLSGEHTYQKGYFDYERDGFGEVVYDLENAIDLIIEYAENGCVLKDKYRKRIDSFFAYNDQNNCQRVLDKILEML